MCIRDSFNAGTIRLKPIPSEMQAVTVVGTRSVLKTEIDKKIFDVDKSLASKGGTAQDALRQVPTLSVDAAGNVTLRNGTPVILSLIHISISFNSRILSTACIK